MNASEIGRSRLYAVGLALLCAKVVLVPLVFHQAFDVPFTVPKALLSHSLGYLLAGVLVALAVRHGRAFLVSSWLHVPVAVFLVANVLATIFAVDRTLALYGTHVRMLGLGTIADWVVLYAALPHLVRIRRDAILVAGCCLVASGLVLAYELLQVIGRDPWRWSMDGSDRAFSTLGQPTTLALYLTVIAVGSSGTALLAPGLDRRVRAALLICTVALLLGAAATGTRSAVLGLAAGSALLVLLVWSRHPNGQARLVSAGGGIVATAALAALLVFSPLGARLATTFEPSTGDEADDGLLARLEPSAAGRVTLYEVAAKIFAERPLLGYGPDNFVVGVPRYRPEAAPEQVRQSLATSAHGWPAHLASTSGVLGLASFVAIALTAMWLTVGAGYRPMAIVAIGVMAAFLAAGVTTVTDIATDWLFWAGAGAVAAATAAPRVVHSPAEPARSRRSRHRHSRPGAAPPARRAAPAVAIGASAVFALASVVAADASRLAQESGQLRLGRSSAEAIDRAIRATREDAGRDQYWHVLGLAYAGAARWRDAATAFERASQLAPYDSRHIADQASAQLLLAGAGDTAARVRAVQLGDEAARVDPNNPRAHVTRATVRQATGDIPEALRSAERALSLDPGSRNPRLYAIATQLLRMSDRASDAISVARTGVQVLGASVESVPLRIELARALEAAGRFVEAISELDAALAIAPNERTALQLRNEIRRRLP